ncbi:MAG: protein-L-isoaspartate O-methyltransferase, partial [Alcanivorax sp.]
EGAPLDKVLEIGTGSGYQTAVLARFAKEIVSLERIKVLQEKARQRLRALKINNVMLRYADGSVGLQEKAPFDGILAAAAPADVPQELLEQLAIGGRLVIPIGEHEQKLFRITRTEQGYEREFIEDVRFVPFRSGLR